MLVVIKGAGDIATGVAARLHRARFQVVMTDIAVPTAVRRTVSFSQAVTDGVATVEGVEARLAQSAEEAKSIVAGRQVAVLVDPKAACVQTLRPDAVVDA
ncbi:MAG: molybdenum hydroxylase, partial [Oscillospiraceae bacterium]|nr:molybdenum hydroxylase [Oscillospiraceae bacterium]